ncbi:hypothetical protein ILYODFUR_038049 [Ilyodon furcidens]|uniref:Uncharacterized protein n=1 Tax=Ilyodon furcidens TaxID=33524 RepID=A0ABV0SU94_9TELE
MHRKLLQLSGKVLTQDDKCFRYSSNTAADTVQNENQQQIKICKDCFHGSAFLSPPATNLIGSDTKKRGILTHFINGIQDIEQDPHVGIYHEYFQISGIIVLFTFGIH